MKKLLIILLILLSWSVPDAATYTVSQTGDGTDYNIAEFNALTGDYSDDIFNFSGTITSQVDPADSFAGTLGSPVILDGWSGGSYNATDGNRTDLASLAELTANSSTGAMKMRGNDGIIIQDFNFNGGGSNQVGILIYDTAGDNPAEWITFRRNFVHGYTENGLWTSHSNSGFGVKYLTIGGASGQGNEFYDISTATEYHELRLAYATEGIVSYNIVDNNDATRTYGTGGITSHSPGLGTTKFLIEYNYVAHQNRQTGNGEVGIGGKGGQDYIVRFNKVIENIDNSQGVGISSGYDKDQHYIYGNWIEGNHSGAGASTGSGAWNKNSIDMTNTYFFSNIIVGNIGEGMWSSNWDSAEDDIGGLWFFNNTIFGNATSPNLSSNTGIRIWDKTLNVNIANNIIQDNRPNEADERQMHFHDDFAMGELTIFNNNRLYDPDGTARIYWGVGGEVDADSVGTNNTIGDPGLTDPDNGDFTIAPGAFCIGAGFDMGSGAIDTITIMGIEYPVYWDIALGPNTDFSGTDPSEWIIDIVRRDTIGEWDQGAMAYVPGGDGDTGDITGLELN